MAAVLSISNHKNVTIELFTRIIYRYRSPLYVHSKTTHVVTLLYSLVCFEVFTYYTQYTYNLYNIYIRGGLINPWHISFGF